MWECSWKLNATSFHCTFQTCVITKLLRTQEIITFSLNFFRTTQCWTERKIYKGMKKYRLKNLIKEQHKRELKIPGNYCQPGLLWTSNYLISPQSHRIINYTAQNNKMSRQITKPHITYSLKKKNFLNCVCVFSGCYTTVLKACRIMLVWWMSRLALTNTFITFPSLK